MQDLNKGSIQLDGSILWEKTFPEMNEEIHKRFSRDVFKTSNNSIIHFKYGGGKIKFEDEHAYLVDFQGKEKEILKKEIKTTP